MSSKRNVVLDIVSIYNSKIKDYGKKDKQLELELRSKITPDQAYAIIDNHSKISVHQMLDVITDITPNSSKLYSKQVHSIHFVSGKKEETDYIKTNISEPVYNKGWKLALAEEIKSSYKQPQSAIYRFKYRVSIYHIWRIDITYTIQTDNIAKVKGIRDTLFANIASIDDWKDKVKGVKELEIELEYTENTKLSNDDVTQIIDYVNDLIYVDNSNDILQEISSHISNRDNRHITLKNITNQVIPLDYMNISNIIENPKRWYITDKADGERSIIYVKNNKIYLVSSNLQVIKLDKPHKISIFDAEIVGNHIYIFDVLFYDGISIQQKPFSVRIGYYQDAVTLLRSIQKNIKVDHKKQFLLPEIQSIVKYKSPYNTDGYIITEDSDYRASVFKVKHEKDITIDFLVRSTDTSKYLLFSGISDKIFTKYKMERIDNYDTLFPHANHEYFPIQFSPSSKPDAYIYNVSGSVIKINLDNKICEMFYNKKNGMWEFVRIRNDRMPGSGYYGNDFTVAENIWESYNDPFTIDKLIDALDGKLKGYFKVHDNPMYTNLRLFNNHVKSKLLKEFKTDIALDLASGKGQDINKYSQGYKKVLFVDNDRVALSELVNRKKSMSGELNVETLALDLLNSYQVCKKAIDERIDSVELIVCNFAIHYFIPNIDTLLRIVSEKLLKKGHFIFTCFDGSKINKLLHNKDKWELQTNNIIKYSIIRKYKGDDIKNAQIDVMLPFTKEHYTEYLVDFDYIKELCGNHSLYIVEIRSFADYYQNSNITLDDNDYKFASLYSAVIIRKK